MVEDREDLVNGPPLFDLLVAAEHEIVAVAPVTEFGN